MSLNGHAALLAVSLLVPTMFALAVLLLQVPIAGGEFETEKYSSIAIDWLRNGWILGTDGTPADQSLNTARLPAYPAFLAVMFAIFGTENYVPVLAAQTLFAGLTIYLVALSAGEFRRAWIWPAVGLAALTLNISYRGTMSLPDNLFTLLTAAVMYAGLRSLSSPHTVRWLLIFGLAGTVAMLCRPVFQFAAMMTLPVLALGLFMRERSGVKQTALVMLAPVALLLVGYGMQVAKVHALTGHAVFSTQTGNHALTWVTPCLAQTLGCGGRDIATLDRARARLAVALSELPLQDRDNPATVDETQRRLARQMLGELNLLSTAISAAAAYAKIMLHSVLYEIYERMDVPAIHLTTMPGESLARRAAGFLSATTTSLPMALWLVSQLAVALSRCLELIGALTGILTREHRWKLLLLAALAAGLLLPTLGIGNPRYRAPAEPMLVILLLQGIATAFRVATARRIQSG